MRYNSCPVTKESFKVYLDSDGHFTSISKGVYHKTNDCNRI